MHETQLIDLLKQGKFDDAQIFIKNNRDIDLNYTDKNKDSILMIAVRCTKANPTRLASFVNFFLEQERFTLVNYSVRTKTAFDLAIISANPDVVQTFVDYHYKNHSLEHAIYAGSGELKFKLVQDCLKSYQSKCRNTPSSDTENLACFRAFIDTLSHKNRILRDVAIRFAMHHDDPTILQQLKEAGDLVAFRLQDNTGPYQWAQQLGKTNIVKWFDDETLSDMASLSKSTSPAAHSMFTNRLSSLTQDQDAVRTSQANSDKTIIERGMGKMKNLAESISKMHP